MTRGFLLNRLIKGFLDILYPRICLVCKKKLPEFSIDNAVCRKCWDTIEKNTPPFCGSCGRHFQAPDISKNTCPECEDKKFYFDRALSPFRYEGTIKELIHGFKYENKRHLGALLSAELIKFIKEYDLPIKTLNAVIPVPIHAVKLREREYNQSQILSEYIAKEFNKEILNGTLIRRRWTKTQTDLRLEERLKNIKGCFCLKQPDAICKKNILLVDDVLTSGATASEAARVLKNGGADCVYVLTVAS